MQRLADLRAERPEQRPDHEANIEVEEGGEERGPVAGGFEVALSFMSRVRRSDELRGRARKRSGRKPLRDGVRRERIGGSGISPRRVHLPQHPGAALGVGLIGAVAREDVEIAILFDAAVPVIERAGHAHAQRVDGRIDVRRQRERLDDALAVFRPVAKGARLEERGDEREVLAGALLGERLAARAAPSPDAAARAPRWWPRTSRCGA